MKKGILLLLVMALALPAYGLELYVGNAKSKTCSNVQFDLGGDVRLRWYDFENFWDFNDNNDTDNFETFRLRTRIYTKATLTDNITGFVRLGNQTYGENVGEGKNADDNVFVDNAYIDIKNFFDLPVDLRLGRQNLMYGSGFVLFDGESEAASTAIFFDAVKLTWHLADTARMDIIYAIDEENSRAENGGDDISLGGAYLTANCPSMGGQQEVYFLNRRDDGIKKDILMTGARLSDRLECGLDYSAEAAYQWGDAYEDATGKVLDHDAWGCKLEAGYSLPMGSLKLRPFVGYAVLSGDDDPNDDEFEGWDVFYGGWPQFGDLLAWTAVNLAPRGAAGPVTLSPNYEDSGTVTGEANYSNLRLTTLGVDVGMEKLKATLSYTKLTIDEEDTAAATNVAFADDDDYGDYYQLKMQYAYCKCLTFALYAAAIDPDDAFPDTNEDLAHEFFLESNLSF